MKKLLCILLLFNVLFFSAQKNISTGKSSVQNMVTTLKHDTCLNKTFSIVFYVVLDSGQLPSVLPGPGNATPAALNTMITSLNAAFKRICVQFLNCSTVYIPNHPFNNWTKNIVDPIVTSNWYTDKTINVYFASQVGGQSPNEVGGYAYPPPPNLTTNAKDVIVLTKGSLNATNVAGTLNHEIIHQFGHFFGLPNTFDEIGSPITPAPPPGVLNYEFFNRTNCYSQGDGFCDTEADCWPLNPPPMPLTSPCGYYRFPGVQDGNNEFYVPPVDNMMSNWACRCRFSQEQYNYMAYIILTRRLYLH